MLGAYDYQGPEKDVVDKFAISIAWRALHALSKDGEKLAHDFLRCESGKRVERATYEYIFKNKPRSSVRLPWLYYWSAKTAAMITGSPEEYPFAWAELGREDKLLGVGVIFAHWVVLWPLFDGDPNDSNNRLLLERICFLSWVGEMKARLSRNE